MDFVKQRRHHMFVQVDLVSLASPEGGLEEVELGDDAAGGLDVGGTEVSVGGRDGDVPHPDPCVVFQGRAGVDDRTGTDSDVVADACAMQHDCARRDVAVVADLASGENARRRYERPLAEAHGERRPVLSPDRADDGPANTTASSPISIGGPLLSITTP
jgi:hypothetical protein